MRKVKANRVAVLVLAMVITMVIIAKTIGGIAYMATHLEVISPTLQTQLVRHLQEGDEEARVYAREAYGSDDPKVIEALFDR